MNHKSQADFGFRLKEAFKNVQNREIAEKLGIGKSAVTAYLRGSMPPASQLLKIAEMTGCNLHWLLTGEGPKWIVRKVPEVKRDARTLLVSNPMGGSGKSTAASFLALALVRRGTRVLVFDTTAHTCMSHFTGFRTEMADLTVGLRNDLGSEEQRAEKDEQTFQRLIRRGGTRALFLHSGVDGLDLCVPILEGESSLERGGARRFDPDLDHLPDSYDYYIFDSLPGTNPHHDFPPVASRYLKSPQVLLPWVERPGLSKFDPTLEYIRRGGLQISGMTLIGVFINHVNRMPPAFVIAAREMLHQALADRMMRTEISYSPNLQSSLFYGRGIQNLSPSLKIVTEYDRLAGEVLDVLTNFHLMDDHEQSGS